MLSTLHMQNGPIPGCLAVGECSMPCYHYDTLLHQNQKKVQGYGISSMVQVTEDLGHILAKNQPNDIYVCCLQFFHPIKPLKL